MATVRYTKPALSHEIHKISARRALPVRREPYWGPPLAQGRHLGYRKIDAERGTWIARLWLDGKQVYRSLGPMTDTYGVDQAREAAAAWFSLKTSGIRTDEVVTVADACRRYVEERRQSKGESCAHDADKRFERTVYDAALGRLPLARIRAPQIKGWRDALGLSKASSNRTLVALKAALNLAVRERNVVAAQGQEWRDVKPLPGASNRRDLYLDLAQRRALLAASQGAIRNLIEAVMLTGARAGELVNARRSQFDARTGSITLSGKTGSRTIPLSRPAVVLFARLAKSKLPAALLLTRDDGKPWAHSDWDELVRQAASSAKLPKGTCLYTLRHSFVTTALTGGLATLDVARLVGTSVTMIEKHYGHLVASAARERLAQVTFV
jgi:integrase